MTLKIYRPIAATIALLAACSNKNCDRNCDSATDCGTNTEAACAKSKTVTYTGTIPAADAEGIECTLVLEYDGDDCREGDYVLTERYIGKPDGTFTTKGDFTVGKGTPKGADQAYLKLVPDHTDRASDSKSDSDDVRYFLVDNDSTVTLTTATLEAPASGLNYSLTCK